MYYAICVMYVVLGVNIIIWFLQGRMTHTIFIHEAQLVTGIPNEPKSELITYKYKIPTQNSNLWHDHEFFVIIWAVTIANCWVQLNTRWPIDIF